MLNSNLFGIAYLKIYSLSNFSQGYDGNDDFTTVVNVEYRDDPVRDRYSSVKIFLCYNTNVINGLILQH